MKLKDHQSARQYRGILVVYNIIKSQSYLKNFMVQEEKTQKSPRGMGKYQIKDADLGQARKAIFHDRLGTTVKKNFLRITEEDTMKNGRINFKKQNRKWF